MHALGPNQGLRRLPLEPLVLLSVAQLRALGGCTLLTHVSEAYWRVARLLELHGCGSLMAHAVLFVGSSLLLLPRGNHGRFLELQVDDQWFPAFDEEKLLFGRHAVH